MKHFAVLGAALAVIAAVFLGARSTQQVSAAACPAPSTDNGTVTMAANVPSDATYRIWTRMAAPNSTDNYYYLEVDGSSCFAVGGSAVPVYSSSATNRFADTAAHWTRTTTGGVPVQLALTAGAHTLKLIGASEGVIVDRVILTDDLTCVPKGAGSNCETGYVASDMNTDGKVDFLDFSYLSTRYNRSDGSIGRSDINSDGLVDFLDLSILSSAYGQ